MVCKVKLHVTGLRAFYKIQKIYIKYRPHRDGPGIESRANRDLPPPVQTGAEVHPASSTLGTGF